MAKRIGLPSPAGPLFCGEAVLRIGRLSAAFTKNTVSRWPLFLGARPALSQLIGDAPALSGLQPLAIQWRGPEVRQHHRASKHHRPDEATCHA
jgi:hypothetical protein